MDVADSRVLLKDESKVSKGLQLDSILNSRSNTRLNAASSVTFLNFSGNELDVNRSSVRKLEKIASIKSIIDSDEKDKLLAMSTIF